MNRQLFVDRIACWAAEDAGDACGLQWIAMPARRHWKPTAFRSWKRDLMFKAATESGDGRLQWAKSLASQRSQGARVDIMSFWLRPAKDVLSIVVRPQA